METKIPREQIDLVKCRLVDVMPKMDSEGCYTLNLAGLLAQDNGFGDAVVWRAFFELLSEGLAMIAATPSGLRFGMTGEMYEAEIKRLERNAYIFRSSAQALKKAI